MNERERAICTAVADWAEARRKGLERNRPIEDTAAEIAKVTKKAKQAFCALELFPPWRNVVKHEEAKALFYEAALPYFRLGVPSGSRMVAHQLRRLAAHARKWSRRKSNIEEADSFLEVGVWLREDVELYAKLEPILEVRAPSLAALKIRILKAFDQLESEEFDREFGARTVYEMFGRETAQDHFVGQSTAKPGRKNSPLHNLDVFRATEFDQVVAFTNTRLIETAVDSSSGREICSISMKYRVQTKGFERSDELRWLFQVHLDAPSISMDGFLNSVSRGRSAFGEAMDDFLGSN